MTAPIGTGGYLLGFVAGEIAKKRHPWLRIVASETPGYVYNLKFHGTHPELWKDTIIGTAFALDWLGRNALAPIDEKLVGYKWLQTNEPIIPFLVTLNPKLKTLNDLVGKKVALGYTAQILYGDMPLRFLVAAGVADQMDIEMIGFTPAVHALMDGLVDASICASNFNPATMMFRPPPAFVELIGTGKKLYYISLEPGLDAMVEKGYPSARIVAPAGMWDYLEEDTVFTDFCAGMGCKDVFPEALAYEVTKFHLEYHEEMGEYHAFMQMYSPEYLMYSQTKATLHPGAIRAYEEAGYPVPD